MKIALSAGHTMSGKGTGAVGYINESQENRVMFNLVKKWLEVDGHTVYSCNVDKADNYLQQQVSLANKHTTDVAVQIHFNAAGTTSGPIGTETLYVSSRGKEYAQRVTNKLGTLYKQRGVKHRDNLYWLNNCKAPTILIEVCFVSSKADCNIYNANKDKTAKLIAEGIVGHTISEPAITTEFVVRVTTDSLNVRSGPGTSYPVTTQVKEGQAFTIVEQKGDWGKLKSGAGWIHLGYTEIV